MYIAVKYSSESDTVQYSAVVCTSECGSDGREFESYQCQSHVRIFGHDRLVIKSGSRCPNRNAGTTYGTLATSRMRLLYKAVAKST